MTPSQRDNLLEAHSQAMARIAALEAERDALKTELHQWEESDAARSVLEPVFTVEIGRLEEENARLRQALHAFAEMPTVGWDDAAEPDTEYLHPVTNRTILNARAALARSPEAKP